MTVGKKKKKKGEALLEEAYKGKQKGWIKGNVSGRLIVEEIPTRQLEDGG